MVDDALSVKPSTDAFKLAGAIAGRMRDGQKATILVKGAVPVLIAVKAIAKAQEYLAQEKDKLSSSTLAFTAALVDRENKDLRNAPTSTFTQLSIVGVPTAAAASGVKRSACKTKCKLSDVMWLRLLPAGAILFYMSAVEMRRRERERECEIDGALARGWMRACVCATRAIARNFIHSTNQLLARHTRTRRSSATTTHSHS